MQSASETADAALTANASDAEPMIVTSGTTAAVSVPAHDGLDTVRGTGTRSASIAVIASPVAPGTAPASAHGDGSRPEDEPLSKRQRRSDNEQSGSAGADAVHEPMPAYYLLQVDGIPDRANKCGEPPS